MRWTTGEVEILTELLKKSYTHKEIGWVLNRPANSVRVKTQKLGLKSVRKDIYIEVNCITCEVSIRRTETRINARNKHFCSQSCNAKYHNKFRKSRSSCINCGELTNKSSAKYCGYKCQLDYQYKQYITKWLSGEETGISGDYSISSHIRKYLYKKYNSECSECGWREINQYTNKVPLEVEHIDGNYLNNKEDNLTLLCPNCHSLTATYKGANRGNGRKSRSKYYLKNKLD